MKNKLFLILILLSILTFAQEQSYGDLEFFGGMPFYNGSLIYNGETEKLETKQTFSFGMSGINYNVYNIDKLALVYIGSVNFPKNIIYTANNNEYSLNGDNFIMSDMMWGMGYSLFEAGMFKFPVTFGFHIMFLSGSNPISDTQTLDLAKINLGLGGSVGAEFHINSFIYFFARAQMSFDFLSYTQDVLFTGVDVGGKMAYYIDGREYFELSAYFGITPVIGLGFRINNLVKLNG